jgi:hypothetical protein
MSGGISEHIFPYCLGSCISRLVATADLSSVPSDAAVSLMTELIFRWACFYQICTE